MSEKHSLNRGLAFVAAMFFLVLVGGEVMAGGSVDTSAVRFADAEFTNSGEIDNPWWTLTEGRNFLYFAQEDEDCLWNLVDVVDMTTDNFGGVYAGTDARVILDRGWVDAECLYGTDPENFADVWKDSPAEEVTYDWYAQDDDQNIWYMGEHTYSAEEGYSGSFVAGCDGAEAGIVMLGTPSKGDFYRQEYYEDEAEDWGKVLNFINASDSTCLKTKEWTPLEPGEIEHKYYCSDGEVGELTQIEELKGKTLIWELVARDLEEVPDPPVEINPVPSCIE